MDHIQLTNPNKVELFVDWVERNKLKGDQYQLIFDAEPDGRISTKKSDGISIIHTPGDQSADNYIKVK